MTKKPFIEDAVAIIPVQDMQRTICFYTEILNFEKSYISNDETFATLKHGEAAIHFVLSNNANSDIVNNISIYLWSNNLDELYNILKPKLESLPKEQVTKPFTQAYGMREFHVKDLDGNLLFFGENN